MKTRADRIAIATALSGGDSGKAANWVHHQPIAAFDFRTAEQLVEAGHADAVIAITIEMSQSFRRPI